MPKLEQPAYSRIRNRACSKCAHTRVTANSRPSKKSRCSTRAKSKRCVSWTRSNFLWPGLIGRFAALTYMLSAENADAHKKHWGIWQASCLEQTQNDPQYDDTLQIVNRFLVQLTIRRFEARQACRMTKQIRNPRATCKLLLSALSKPFPLTCLPSGRGSIIGSAFDTPGRLGLAQAVLGSPLPEERGGVRGTGLQIRERCDSCNHLPV